jgi:hypothetical protein
MIRLCYTGGFSMPLFRTQQAALLGSALMLMTSFAHGDPWIAPGDATLRHHIEVLADAHVLHVPVTAWPLMWSGIADDIRTTDTGTLDPLTQESLAYVRAALQRETGHDAQLSARLEAGSSPEAYHDFGTTRREKTEATAGIAGMGDRWAARLDATAVQDPVDGKKYRPDGSYVAGFLGNWSVSAGWLDRWWGPGWQSSLILGDDARPVPGITLQRDHSDAFSTPLLSWMGPWQFTAFAGQLEPNGVPVPDAKFVGGRLNFKPMPSLEIGLSRTAQWGGQGRSQSIGNFGKMLLGIDNTGSDGIVQKNDPSNQEAGYDLRWSFSAGGSHNALYAQMIGEDNAGGLPSRFMYLAGAETAFKTGNWQHRLSLEGSQTNANGFGKHIRYNYVYEHHIYREGYRYYGRPLGASFDNDSRTLSLAGDHFLNSDKHLSWVLAWLDINMDGTNLPAPGGNVFGPHNTGTGYARLGWGFPLYERWSLTLGGEYYRQHLRLDGEPVRSGAFAKLERPL